MVNLVPISEMPSTSYKGSLIIPAVDLSLALGNQNVSITASTLVSGATGSPYDVGIFVPGTYTNSQVLGNFVMVRQVIYTNNFSPSVASCPSASSPTGSVVLEIEKNGSAVGTLTFAASGTSGTFSSSSTTTFNSGDLMSIIAPSIADSTFGNLAVTLTGNLG